MAAVERTRAMEEQELHGREARIAFWQALWAPLLAFGLVGSNEFSTYLFLVILLASVISIVLNLHTFQKWLYLGQSVIGAPNAYCYCTRFGLATFFGMGQRGSAAMDAQEEINMSAALTLVIFLYYALPRRNGGTDTILISGLYSIVLGVIIYVLYLARDAGFVENVDVLVYFKATALISLLMCMPHLYTGISPRRSTAILCIFLFLAIPAALTGIHYAVQYGITTNEAIESRVDDSRFYLVLFYMMIEAWEVIVSVWDIE